MEYGFKKLLSEKVFLQVARRARKVNGVVISEILYNKDKVVIKCNSVSRPGLRHTVEIQIQDLVQHRNLEQIKANTKKGNQLAHEFKKAAREAKDPLAGRKLEKVISDSELKCFCSCIAEGTLVKTNNGWKPIQQVEAGDKVLNKEGEWDEVLACLDRGEQECIAFGIKGQMDPLLVTEDHLLWMSTFRDVCACGCGRNLRVMQDDQRVAHARRLPQRRLFLPKHAIRGINDHFEQFKWVQAGDYKPGWILTAPKIKGSFKKDARRAFALGLYLAEGHICGNVVYLTLNQNEEETLGRFIKESFTEVKIKKLFYKDRKWLSVRVYDKEYAAECKRICGRGSMFKSIAPEVFSWEDEAKLYFLCGHLLGDGSLDQERGYCHMTTSRQMVWDLQALIQSLGKEASMSFHNIEGSERRHACFQVTVSIPEYQDVYNIAEENNLLRGKDIIKPSKSRGKTQGEYVYKTVTSVSPGGTHRVYDLVLKGEDHSFVANGVIVHNCEAFTYWGFKYIAWRKGYGIYKETRRPKVRNPHQKGLICKHLYCVLHMWPLLAKTVARKMLKNDPTLQSDKS